MLITEYFRTREDGVVLNKAYSDAGFYIRELSDPRLPLYEEAIYPDGIGKVFEETDQKIPVDEERTEEAN